MKSITRSAAFSSLLLSILLVADGPRLLGAEEAKAALGPGPLPEPPRSGDASLVDVLWKRKSVRKFAARPITREQLGFLLWAAGGINRPEEKRRTTPAAWGAYAVSVYVTSKDGTLVYDPVANALKAADTAAGKDLRREIPTAEFTRSAPVNLILVADFSRYPEKSSTEMRQEIVHADCGVIAQNIYLAAAALGLGTVMTADVRPESQALLGLRPSEKALYVLPVGYPQEPSQEAAPASRPAEAEKAGKSGKSS